MNQTQIDSLDKLDISRLSFKDIACRYYTGRAVHSGDEIYGKRIRKKYSYRTGVMTNIGDVRTDVWIQLAEALIKHAGETELLGHIHEYVKEFPRFARATKEELWREALDYHVSGLYDVPLWVGYIPFNRKYRPKEIRQSDIVWVINECCDKPGEVTRQQLDSHRQQDSEATYCPHCGRLSKCTIMEVCL